jgi:hypothetical protein
MIKGYWLLALGLWLSLAPVVIDSLRIVESGICGLDPQSPIERGNPSEVQGLKPKAIKTKPMKLREISELLNATVRCGEDRLDEEHETAFASDLMSDVLTLGDYNPVILTGLCNMQTIRTCEMGNLDIIVLVRRKKATEEMIEEAEDEGMVVMESDFSMFKACGLLFQNGMQPIF